MNKPLIFTLSALGPIYSMTAHSEVYMSEEQAVKVIFPTEKMEKTDFTLNDADVKVIEDKSNGSVRSKKLVFWKNKSKDLVVIDQVLGKHEFITYAVGITSEGKVQAVEILEYRESYGHQVRKESWRKQFVGKDKTSPLKLDEDIKNISGATLSSSHIAAGVKRLLQTYETIKTRI